MRILHLIHSEGVYGAERVLLYLAREQRQRGYSPIVCSIRDPGTPQTPFEALASSWQLPVVPIRIAPRPTPGVVRSLLRTTRELKGDVLHSHGYKANILLGPMPRRVRGPMLATLHGWTGGRTLSALWLYEKLDKLALRSIDAVVVVTRQMLALAALRGISAGRRHAIDNGIPPLAVRLADLEGTPLPAALVDFVAQRPTLIAIGRLSAEKGFALLLEAFARARSQGGHPHQLLIVGEGPERQALARRVVGLGLSSAVQLAGYVEGADRLLSSAHGFVMSSTTEGLPLVLLEAMQWRLPILATAVGAISELLDAGRRGRLVPPNDLRSLAEGLQEMMSASSEDERTRTAYAAVTAHFTSQRMSADYARVYDSIRADAPARQNGDARLPPAAS
ncbi:MAG: glycosyltransferase [Terriglobales bacterium]